MKTKIVDLDVHGLKCDHCDWKDEAIQYDDYKKYVNTKCPVCGEIILTETDYNTVVSTVKIVNFINKFSFLTPLMKNKERYEFKGKVDGKGSYDVVDGHWVPDESLMNQVVKTKSGRHAVGTTEKFNADTGLYYVSHTFDKNGKKTGVDGWYSSRQLKVI